MKVPRTAVVRDRLVGPALETMAGQARGLTRLLGSAGAGTVTALPLPAQNLLRATLSSLDQLADQLPSVTSEIDVLVGEIQAKRLSIQALQAELGALDAQLGVLEKSLAPIQLWSHQMGRLRSSLAGHLTVSPMHNGAQR